VDSENKRFQKTKDFILKPMTEINQSHNFAKGNSNSGCVVFFECRHFQTFFELKFVPIPDSFLQKYKEYIEDYRLIYLKHKFYRHQGDYLDMQINYEDLEIPNKKFILVKAVHPPLEL
jgi:hypothetical protein